VHEVRVHFRQAASFDGAEVQSQAFAGTMIAVDAIAVL